jgi:hypothetical protein
MGEIQEEVVGRQRVALSGAASGLTAAGSNVYKAILSVEDAPIRWTAEGTTATTTVGQKENKGAVFEITGKDIADFSMINISANAVVNIAYSKRIP